jgi:hypothetical protein
VYLTSQHVLSASNGSEGVNTYLYFHGACPWPQPSAGVQDQNPGTLAAQSISIRPAGNRVRSYLDVIAPDETPWAEVRAGWIEFLGRCQRSPMPWTGQSGRCFFRLGMELGLARQWHHEVAVLYRASQALRLATPACIAASA